VDAAHVCREMARPVEAAKVVAVPQGSMLVVPLALARVSREFYVVDVFGSLVPLMERELEGMRGVPSLLVWLLVAVALVLDFRCVEVLGLMK
jgi:hypothetical protein